MNSEELGWSCPVALEWQDGIAMVYSAKIFCSAMVLVLDFSKIFPMYLISEENF